MVGQHIHLALVRNGPSIKQSWHGPCTCTSSAGKSIILTYTIIIIHQNNDHHHSAPYLPPSLPHPVPNMKPAPLGPLGGVYADLDENASPHHHSGRQAFLGRMGSEPDLASASLPNTCFASKPPATASGSSRSNTTKRANQKYSQAQIGWGIRARTH